MPLPSDVQLLTEVGATRLILPPRLRTGPRWLPLIPICFGLIFSGFAVLWIINALDIHTARPHHAPAPITPEPEDPAPLGMQPDAPPPEAFNWGNLFAALFGLPFFIVGLFPLGLGILMFFPNHAEITITADELIAIEQMGPVRFRRRRPIAKIAKLRIGQTFEKSKDSQTGHREHGIFAEIIPSPDSSLPPPLRLAQRYPLDTLTPLAEFLLAELKRRGSTSFLHAETPGVVSSPLSLTIDPEPIPTGAPETPNPPIPQPENSQITFLPAPDSLTFIIPRTGFRGTARFFLIFSLFWNTLSFTFFAIMLFQLIREPSLENLGILGFLSIFVAIGTATALAAIQTAFHKSVLLATRDSLVFTQTGPIRKTEYQWTPTDLAAIRCANSGTTVNNQPLKQLQVHATANANPAQRNLLTGRDENELLWLAFTLRAFYRVRS